MMKTMTLRTKLVACWALALSLIGATASFAETAAVDTTKAAAAAAPAVAAAPVDSALMVRVADLEAYINNTGATKPSGVPGPGHNRFMSICAPLVLFLSLPGR